MSHWLDKYIREQANGFDMGEMAEAQEDMERNYESEEEYLNDHPIPSDSTGGA